MDFSSDNKFISSIKDYIENKKLEITRLNDIINIRDIDLKRLNIKCKNLNEEYENYQKVSIVKNLNTQLFEKDNSIKLPHVGWNSCSIKKKNLIFKNIKDNQDFYFCHSYGVNNLKDNNVVSETYYYEQFVSAVEKDNIFGVQFHPEKSQLNGLQILKNFCEN